MSRSERKKRKNNQKKKSNKMGLGKKILLGILGVILAIGIGGLGLFTYYASAAPELTEEDLTGTYAAELVDMNGDVFYTLGGDEREYAAAEEYPQVLIDAVMAIEDQRFENHTGIDPIGIARAAVGYVTNAGEIVGGGSTVTQQLIKLSVFSTKQEDQTLERKAQEAWLAIQLEQELSKEQIMTLYLNRIHMGGNVYGAATAAEEYYGKHVSELELHEAALFAAMPKAPNFYNPYVNVEAAEERRNLVLDQMVDFGSITQEEADAAKQIPVTEGLQEPEEDENTLVFDAYLTAVIDEVEEKTNFDPYTSGITIYTNYDPNAQEILYQTTNTNDYVNFPNDEIQTAATLVDSTTGKITAMIGGRNLEGQLSTNRATDLDRSVASTIKPLTVYGPAIEFLHYSTYEQVVDEPYSVGNWSPSNYDNSFRGQMSMREALVDSRNIPAAKFFNEEEHLGNHHAEISEFLEGLGIDVSEISPGADGLVPSSAFNGTMSPVDLAGAYAAFANQGVYTEPYTVTKIVDVDGQEYDLTPSSSKAMEEYTAYMINDMLKDVISYYSAELTIPGYIHAAKTGTTNYTEEQITEANIPSDGVPDNWVVGYSPYYTMSVWVGYDQQFEEGNSLVYSDGSRRLARYIYQAAMSRIVEGLEERDWQQPDSVVERTVVDGSNPPLLAPEGSSGTVTELFVRDNQPTEVAEPDYELTAPTGLSARYSAAEDTIQVSWDSYELPEDVDEDVEYVISVNGQESVQGSTGFTIPNPPRELIQISVAVRVAGETGPAAQVELVVQEQEEPEDTEEPDDTEEPNESSEPDESEDSEDTDDTDDGPPQNDENEENQNGGNNGDTDSNGNGNNESENGNSENNSENSNNSQSNQRRSRTTNENQDEDDDSDN